MEEQEIKVSEVNLNDFNDYSNYGNYGYEEGQTYDPNMYNYNNYNYNNYNNNYDVYQGNNYDGSNQYDYNQNQYSITSGNEQFDTTEKEKKESDVSESRTKKLDSETISRTKYLRKAAGKVWDDTSLAAWSENDFRIFVGNLGNEVSDEQLKQSFAKYPSFAKARVIRDKRTQKTRGYGFVSFLDSQDMIRALKEMNGRYICNRPCKLTRSRWKDRSVFYGKKEKKE